MVLESGVWVPPGVLSEITTYREDFFITVLIVIGTYIFV